MKEIKHTKKPCFLLRVLLALLTALFCITAVLSFAAVPAALGVRHSLGNSEALCNRIADGEYCSDMYDEIYGTLRRRMALVVITPEDVADIITEEAVAREAKAALTVQLERLFCGGKGVYSYENDGLYEHIDTLLEGYAAETGIEYADGSADEVYTMICESVTEELCVAPEAYIAKLSPYTSKAAAAAEYWFVPAGLAVLSTVIILAAGRRNYRSAVYTAALSAYVGAFAALAAAWILEYKDYLRHTVIGDGMLQTCLRGVYGAVLGDVKAVALAMCVPLLAAGIAVGICAMTASKKGNGEE